MSFFVIQAEEMDQSHRSLPFEIHGSTIECHGDYGIEVTGDVAPPIHVSTTFLSGAPESHGQIYSRLDNISRQRLEALISAIAGGQAVTYSNGQSASTALIHCLKPKRIYLDAGYYGIRMAFSLWNERQSDAQNHIEYLTFEQCQSLYDRNDTTENRCLDLIWIETPNNPCGNLADLKWFSELAKRTGAFFVIDSTLAPPISQRPFDYGVDIVMHSSTKYFSGHSDLLGGVLIVHPSKSDILVPKLKNERSFDGAVMGNLETWLLLRSIRTLSLRVQQQSKTALILAQWLEQQRFDGNKVTKVHHPSLESHKSYHLAKLYLRLPIATFSFELESESQAMSFIKSLLLCTRATSLGGVETLVDWRYFHDKTVSPALVRVSVGLEETDDILTDFQQALEKAC